MLKEEEITRCQAVTILIKSDFFITLNKSDVKHKPNRTMYT